jgi:glutamate-5-semialdehyde dehydrogenase
VIDPLDDLSLSRTAARRLALLGPSEKRESLLAMADGLEKNIVPLVEASRPGPNEELLDDLHLDRHDVTRLAQDIRVVARAPDPIGNLLESRRAPSGVEVSKISVPLGVVAFWHRSNPILTAIATALAVKSGNALVLAGPGATLPVSQALFEVLLESGLDFGLPIGFLKSLPLELAPSLSQASGINLLILRRDPKSNPEILLHSRIPILEHQPGICGLYVDASANLEVAYAMLIESTFPSRECSCRIRRVLIHEDLLEPFLERCAPQFRDRMLSLVADPACQVALRSLDLPFRVEEEMDLSPHLKLACVQSSEEALEAFNHAGPRALDAIATSEWSTARRFEHESESVCVAINTVPVREGVGDLPAGFDLGFVTQSRHARGPITLTSLVTTRQIIRG